MYLLIRPRKLAPATSKVAGVFLWIMKHLGRWVLPLGLIGMVAGCGGSRKSNLVGSWKARPGSVLANTLYSAMGGSAPGSPAAASVQTTREMANATIDIRADKTFTLNADSPVEGTWTFDEHSSATNMTVTKVAGRPLLPTPDTTTPDTTTPDTTTPATTTPNPAFTCQLDSDNSMLTINSPDTGVSPVVRFNGLNLEKS